MAETTLTNADAGRSVAINSGDTVVVRLEENPGTAYLWKVEDVNSRVLELVSDEHEMAAGRGIGGGGERKLVFRAREAGTSPLRLKCVRQWEPENPSNTFSATIQVHA